MYAVIKAGAHQQLVREGEYYTVDKIEGKPGDKVVFDQVIMFSKENKQVVGQPYLDKTSVEAVIKEQKRNPKIIIFKYLRRKNSKKKQGHKQAVTVVEVKKIKAKA